MEVNKPSENPETRQKIKSEFLARLQEVPYGQVFVKDLVERLGMSRQNFYRYYTSKEEILLEVVDDVCDRLYQLLDAHIELFVEDPASLVSHLFPVLQRNRELIREVLERGTDEVVFSHLRRFVRRGIGRLMREKGVTVVHHEYLDVLIAKVSGGGFYAVKAWSSAPVEFSEDDVVSLFRPLLQDIVDSLHRVGE